jgi:hypothetical protein
MAAKIVIRKVGSMTKPASRKKKRTGRGKSQKSTGPRSLQNRNREAQLKTKQKVPAKTATLVKFIYVLGNLVIGAVFLWLWSLSVAHTAGVAGTVKIASVTLLPLIAFTYVIEVAQRGFTRTDALRKTARTQIIVFGIASLLVLPVLWRKIGYQEICWHVFLGGAIGLTIAFLSWLYLARRHPWLIRQQHGQWVWVYRFSASILIFVGGWIGVIVR